MKPKQRKELLEAVSKKIPPFSPETPNKFFDPRTGARSALFFWDEPESAHVIFLTKNELEAPIEDIVQLVVSRYQELILRNAELDAAEKTI